MYSTEMSSAFNPTNKSVFRVNKDVIAINPTNKSVFRVNKDVIAINPKADFFVTPDFPVSDPALVDSVPSVSSQKSPIPREGWPPVRRCC
jgi:hypothetical protein